MIDNWFEDWLDVDIIEKKEENEIHNNDICLVDADRANNNDTSAL